MRKQTFVGLYRGVQVFFGIGFFIFSSFFFTQSVSAVTQWSSVDTGGAHTCGIKTDGTATCWGYNSSGQSISPPLTFSSISAGGLHTCGIKTDGTATCWGNNTYGQSTPPSGTFSSIITGYSHTCGIKTDGTVACWGYNFYGQSTPPSGTFSSISSGDYHTCGIKSDGTLVCWGNNINGQSTPPSGTFSSISAGGNHTCGIKSDGTLVCWGLNAFGQSNVSTGTFSSISAGGSHTCGIKTDGTVACWGFNGDSRSTPPSGTFSSISAGGNHTCGIKTDGTVACWGNNVRGQATPPVGSNPPAVVELCKPYLMQCPTYFFDTTATDTKKYIYQNWQKGSDTNKIHTENLADPVTLSNGESVYENTLLSLPGKGISYEFKITNRSRVTYDGPIGNGWDHNYNRYLRENADGSVDYYNGSLGIIQFQSSGTGTYAFQGLIRANLAKTATGYTLSYLDGRTELYGTGLRMTTMRDASGNSMAFQYDGQDRLTRVIDTTGKTMDYTYASDGRISGISAPGQTLTFAYANTDLTSITVTASGMTKTLNYTYSAPTLTGALAHNLMSFTDAKGQTYVTNTYDANDRIVSQTYGSGTLTYAYETNASGAVTRTTVTNKRGVITDYTYDQNGNNLSMIVRGTGGLADITYLYTYDTLGQKLTEKKPRGNGIKYTYDTQGNITEVRQKADMSAADNDSSDKVTKYTYDTRGNIIKTIHPNGKTVDFTYTASGKLQKSDTIGTGKITETYAYDTAGRLVEKLDGEGNPTSYEYDTSDRPTRLTRGTGAEASSTLYTYNAYGFPLTETDGRGNTKTFTYDAFNRLVTSTTAEGAIRNFLYDPDDNLLKESTVISPTESADKEYEYTLLDKVSSENREISSSTGARTEFFYDANENLIKTLYPNGLQELTAYDMMERVSERKRIGSQTSTITYQYDANGNLTSENKNGAITSYEYDLYDRRTKMTDALGTYRTFVYDKGDAITREQVYSVSGSLLQETAYAYDILGNLVQKSEKKLEDGTSRNTWYTYDKNSRKIKEKNALGHITTYGYDTLGRQIRTTLPNGAQKTLVYDKNDNTLSETELIVGKDFVTNHTYDRDNRRLSTTTPDNQTTTFAYNTLDQQIKVTSPKSRETNRTYDYEGRLLTETVANKTTSYEYDLFGNRTKLVDAKNNITTYEYNSENLLTKMVNPAGKITEYTYDLHGNIKTAKDPNGTITTYTYDALGRNTRKDFALGSGVSGITWETYTYDALGRLTTSTDSAGHTVSFAYDTVGNLVSETNASKTLTYTYDALGRRTGMMTPLGRTLTYTYDDIGRVSEIREGSGIIASYGYNPMSLLHITLANGITTDREYDDANRLSKIGATSLTYDAHGNIISRGSDTYTYDIFDQVTEVQYSDSRLGSLRTGDKYLYDLMGNRETGDTRIMAGTGGGNWQNIYNYQTNNLNQYTNITFAYTGSAKIEPLPPTSSGTTNTGGTNTGSTSSGTTNTGTTSSGTTSTCTTATGSSCDTIPPDTYTGVIIIDPPPGPVYETEGTPPGDTSVTDGADTEMLIASAILPGEPGYPGDTGSGTTSSGSTYTGSTSSGTLPPGVISPNPPTSTGSLPPVGAYTGSSSTGTATLVSTLTGILLYDNNGNLIGNSVGGQQLYEFVYDARNRLLSVARFTAPGTKVTLATYDYDPLGRRITKSTGDTTITYIYAGYTAIEEYTTTNSAMTATRQYTLTPNAEDDILHMRLTPYSGGVATTPQDYYYEKDHLGSIIRITDKDQNVIDEYTYSLFGQPYRKTQSGTFEPINTTNTSPIGNTRLYTGREYDTETGLAYHRARYYDPAMGRFLSPDPIGTTDDINLYRYVKNSPLMYTDPDGRMAKPFLAFVGKTLDGFVDTGLNTIIILGDEISKTGKSLIPIGAAGGCIAGGMTLTTTTAGAGIVLSPAGCAVGSALGVGTAGAISLAGSTMKMAGQAGKDLKEKLSGKSEREEFHREIKPSILKDAGKENYINRVGKNPDIDIKNGTIILKGNGEYKGRIYETDLKSEWYFNN